MFQNIDNTFFTTNREQLYKELEPDSIVIINSNDKYLRNGDQHYPFRQNSTFYYFTGITQEKSIAIFFPDSPYFNLREILLIQKPDETNKIWTGHQLSKEEAIQISGIKTVFWLENFDTVVREILSYAKNIYINSNEYPKVELDVDDRDNRMTNKLKELYPLYNYLRLAPIASKLRLIKKPYEIESIKKGCEITRDSFFEIVKHIKPGVNEKQIEAVLSYEFNKRNCHHSFHPIVASGENACILHYNDNNAVMKDGDLLLLDFGVEYNYYATDCSRTVAVGGKFTEKQKKYYQAVVDVYKKLEKMFVVGNCIDNINLEAADLYNKMVVELNLATEEEVLYGDPENPVTKKFFMHGISHFIGIDVHDVGSKNIPFENGMVLSCEPGLYISDENIGIRIENMILINDDKPINLTSEIPFEIEVIEKLISKNQYLSH